MTERCGNCKYWNCDTGFCEVKMIITSGKELCEYWSQKNEHLAWKRVDVE